MAQPLHKETASPVRDARSAYIVDTKKRGFAANTNYAPTYPTISGDFNERYERGGISNVVATPKNSGNTPGNMNYAPRTIPDQISSPDQGIQNTQSTYSTQQSTPNKKRSSLIKKMKAGSKASAAGDIEGEKVSLASARFQTGIAMSWTGLLNAIAFPLGLLSAGAFAGTAVIATIAEKASDIVGETVTNAVTAVTAWAFGVDPSDVWILAIGLYVLYMFFIITMFFGSYIQLKMRGLEPLGGKAAGAKSLTFLAALLISAVPASTFLPWIFIWLFVVMIYPN